MVLYVDLYVWLLLEIIVAIADLEQIMQIPAPVTEVEPTNSEMVTGIVRRVVAAIQLFYKRLPHRYTTYLLLRRRRPEKGSFTRRLCSCFMHSCSNSRLAR